MTDVAPEDLTLGRLVAGARNGDKRAWDLIVDQCAPLIWSICRRYGLGRVESEDVAQTAWLRLVERLDDVRDPEALPGWLATTTRRECMRVLESAARQAPASYALNPDTMPDEQLVAAEHDLVIAERNALLWEAIATLPPRCRHLLAMLTADPPVPYAKISAELGIAQGSVGAIRARCLQRLRNYPPLAAVIDRDRGELRG
jgi:RNA polymerase sigma factor (sigma-70 family)